MTSRTLVHTLQRGSRRLLVLAVVAALAVPVVRAANRLQMVIDGEVHQVLSFDDTVGEVLASEGVVIAAGDQVLPAPDTPLDDVSSITVLRTIEADLTVDGETTTHRGTFRTVEGLLEVAGVTVADTDVVRPAPRTQLGDGDTVTVTRAATVRIVADGETRTLATHAATVADVLALSGTELGEEDLLEPGLAAPVADGTTITVQRVGYDEVTEEVALPFDEERRASDALFTDQSRVVQAGEEGLRVDTYRLTLVDGEQVERELVDQEVVREPVTRVVEYGTAARPSQAYIDDGSVWYDLARCESGLRWSYNGRFDGGLQFHPDTWSRNKPAGYPAYAYQATPQQQIEVGKLLQSRVGWGAWPSCSLKLGLR